MEWEIWSSWRIIFCIRYSRLFWIYPRKHEAKTDSPSIKICVNKIDNRVIFKIKTEYYLKFLTPETMKLLGSIEKKINENKNGENNPYLEITEVVLHWSSVSSL